MLDCQVMVFFFFFWILHGRRWEWFVFFAPDDYEGMDTYGHGKVAWDMHFHDLVNGGRRAGLGLGMGYHRWQYTGFYQKCVVFLRVMCGQCAR